MFTFSSAEPKFKLIMDKIRIGTYIVVQRQDFTKLQRFDSPTTTVTLGRDIVELKNIEGQFFGKTFKMKMKIMETGSKKKRIYELELCDNVTNVRDILKSFESGSDNRNLIDSQEVKKKHPAKEILDYFFSIFSSQIKI